MSEQKKPKIDLETLLPVRHARARCLLEYVTTRGAFVINRLSWKEGWTQASIDRAADDLAKARLVTVEALPNGLALTLTS